MKTQHALTLFMMVFETLTFCGVFMGWAEIYTVLVKEGYFSHGCNSTTTDLECTDQTEKLNLVFTITSSTAPILCLLSGRLYDKKGGWVTRTAMVLVVMLGNLLNAVSSPQTSYLLYVSFPLIYVGGYSVANTNLGLPNLYDKIKSTAVAVLCGAFDSSAAVYLIMRKVYDSGAASFASLFVFSTCYGVVFLFNTFVLTPHFAIPENPPKDFQYGYKDLSCYKSRQLRNGNNNNAVADVSASKSEKPNREVEPLKSCLTKVYTWTHNLHFCVYHFSLTFFIGSFNNWIEHKIGLTQTEEISHFVTVFGAMQCCTILFSPVSGLVNDFFRRKSIRRGLASKEANMKASAITLMIGDFLIVVMFSIALSESPEAQYGSMLLQVAGRSFLYSTSASFISVGYPSAHLGTLYSLMECCGGFALLLQFPATLLVVRSFKSNYDPVYGALLCLCVLALAHPLYLLWRVKGAVERKNEKVKESYVNPVYESSV